MEAMALFERIECSYCHEPITWDQEATTCCVCHETVHIECSAPVIVARATRLDPPTYADECLACLEEPYEPDWEVIADAS